MQKTFYLILLCLILCTTVVSFGQERKITEEELKTLIASATEKRKGVPQRQKIVTTGYAPDDRSETKYEFGPNETFHVISNRKSNGVETKTETIRIGTTRYDRQKDGTWLKFEPKPPGSVGGLGSGNGSGSGISSGKVESTKEILFIGNEKIGKEKVSHYRSTNKVVFRSGTPVRTRFVVYDYWFRDDGMLIREVHEDGFENSRQRYKSTTDYEYTNDISIVAPKL
ncbi:MAG TPA: hypothetical protein PLL77_04385 [Pyrinomonadaceae bacterium]|nr:hypothetical protein [Pyrinomonadaceae bacterium]